MAFQIFKIDLSITIPFVIQIIKTKRILKIFKNG